MNKTLTLSCVIAIAMAAFAETPTVTDVVAKQRFPWNGLVDITCKVSGISGTTNGREFDLSVVLPGSGDVRKISQFWVVKNGVNSTDKKVQANGTYKLLWNAKADLGAVVYTNMVVRVVVDRDKVQLWADGPYWATTNIGAEEPWEYGCHFWWGDTIGYKRENNAWVASDGSSSNFSFVPSNTPTLFKGIDNLKSEGWITADCVLMPEHDVAHVQWGGRWRMPTKQELDDLISKCSWNWTAMNGVQGYLVSGTGDYAFASIFLPCAGNAPETVHNSAGSEGGYWSSCWDPDGYPERYMWALNFGSRVRFMTRHICCYGLSVRPVQGGTD